MYRIQVHALKGNAATVGHMLISQIAKLLENAARNKNTELIRTLTPVLCDEVMKCEEILIGVKPMEDNNKAECQDMDTFKENLMMLEKYMSDYDFNFADEKIKEIDEFSYNEEIQTLVDQLKISETNLDVDGVKEICEKLLTII